ncbi:MAG: GGDEF domain-containing protein, partial [Verrucomicrobiota bacterium]|nr:GGDEF domain-containing protein [Verrucomicrobiota bacterium]
MANQKIKLISFLCIILILGFLTINIVNYLISVSLVRKQIVTQSLPLTPDNIYFKIQKELQKPIGIASSMAKNSFLIEWILKGEKEKTEI